MSPALATAAVLLPLPEAALANLRAAFSTVHYHPDFTLPSSIRSSVEFIYTSNRGIPHNVSSLSDLPSLKHIQLASAGADKALASPAVKAYAAAGGHDVTLGNASGTHVISIPNYVVGTVIAIYHQLHTQIIIARNEKRWDATFDPKYYARKTWGRTAGMLGYGALGRESARLLKAHGMRVIAANTSGKASPETEYVMPGTGDEDGSIPDAYYSTKDEASFSDFLKQCDVLVASLPSTPATRFLLTKERLALLPKDALLINVGRGDLVSSADLLAALEPGGNLLGAALDVTDPEPLPDNHALWSHPKVIVTPHLSGDSEDEMLIAADIAIANADKIRKGERPYNLVDYTKGY
ncbi:hypothetical protein Q5752_004782 [Cryptotrichosporon argae]